MEFRNYSNHQQVVAAVYSSLPVSPDKLVSRLGLIDKGTAKSADIPQGPAYYISVANSNIGPLPAGTVIAQTGGVYAGSTVTLNENDTLIIT